MIAFLLVISLVSAIGNDRAPTPRPFVLYFYYNGEPVDGMKVSFEVDLQSVILETNENGGVQVDWDLGYSPQFREGRSLTGWDFYSRILRVNCGLKVCNKNYPFENLDIPHTEIYELSTESVETEICPDGTEIVKGTKCPAIPEPEVITKTKIICGDGEEVDNEEDCLIPPDKDESWLVKVLKIIALLFAGAGGWKFYRGVLTHYHKGIRGYHNAQTSHRNTKYRHSRFWDSPLQCIRDVKKIQSTGSVL